MEKTKEQNFFLTAKNPSGNVVIGVSVKLPEEKRINHSYLSAVPSALNKTKKEIVNYIGQFGLLFKMEDGAKQLGVLLLLGLYLGRFGTGKGFGV